MKMKDLFPNDFGYMCEKLPEYAERYDRVDFQKGAMQAHNVADVLRAVVSHLDSGTHSRLHSDLERALYALARLESFFSDQEACSLKIEDAYIIGDWTEREAKDIMQRVLALKD